MIAQYTPGVSLNKMENSRTQVGLPLQTKNMTVYFFELEKFADVTKLTKLHLLTPNSIQSLNYRSFFPSQALPGDPLHNTNHALSWLQSLQLGFFFFNRDQEKKQIFSLHFISSSFYLCSLIRKKNMTGV